MEALWNKFTKNDVASTASFVIILVGIEKLLALQFACPCSGLWSNGWRTGAIFLIPTIMMFALMLIKKGFECEVQSVISVIRSVISVISPMLFWVMLIFLDGRYFTCAMTGWEGRYVQLEGADAQGWCKPNNSSFICPDNENLEPLQGCMLQSQKFLLISQGIGLGLMAVMCLILVLVLIGAEYFPEHRADPNPNITKVLNRTAKMSEININLDDVYDFIVCNVQRKSGETTTAGATPTSATPTTTPATTTTTVPAEETEEKQKKKNQV